MMEAIQAQHLYWSTFEYFGCSSACIKHPQTPNFTLQSQRQTHFYFAQPKFSTPLYILGSASDTTSSPRLSHGHHASCRASTKHRGKGGAFVFHILRGQLGRRDSPHGRERIIERTQTQYCVQNVSEPLEGRGHSQTREALRSVP